MVTEYYYLVALNDTLYTRSLKIIGNLSKIVSEIAVILERPFWSLFEKSECVHSV